ncbi:MOSC domain-containing protein [Methyloglobulus morosus KoM1]|uniref:MOSC domain-containing protein n=1 Tax=Methyloglobulus morosus KoM1 TaxID=1116472 RepID=V5BHT6_9GAMM|nr:MOSC N-terminal beta barrel domain-containing protein [Methyloglobulus morosus]ESS72870.1 MOSC domain-containing protein [Methyloglobulus morosus KoM1]
MTSIVLSDIYIYPVKSLTGISVLRCPVVETGLKYDRKWMLVDSERQFLSQRRLPKMALIKTALTEKALILSAPGMDDMTLPLEPTTSEIVPSTVWHDQVDTIAVSAEADEWFSQFLSMDCRLVFQPDSAIRPVNPDFAQPEDQTALSDGFPFLLISENSLVALNQAMQLELAMIRFRPNLVVSGCEGYAEDFWRDITIGNIGFRLPKPCSRCAVPTINPETGESGKEPLTTLNRLRKWQNKVYFGQNALHNDLGVLSVGDSIQINLTGSQQPPLSLPA